MKPTVLNGARNIFTGKERGPETCGSKKDKFDVVKIVAVESINNFYATTNRTNITSLYDGDGNELQVVSRQN